MKIEQKIGFDKIKEQLKSLTLSSLGKNRVDEINYLVSASTINRMLSETMEFKNICLNNNDFPINSFYDAKPFLNKIKTENTYITPEELLMLKRSLDTIKAIKRFFDNEENREKYPNLHKLLRQVKIFPYIYDSINRIIDKNGEIKSNASKELRDIRLELSRKLTQVSSIIHREFKKAKQAGLVEKDVNISVRNGKLLIPVSAYDKNKISGVVQAQSSTGKTVFIEPIESIELQNQIKELEFAEHREIIKILIEFANSIRPYIDNLLNNYYFLAEIDFIRAKALFSITLNATKPKIVSQSVLDFRYATHPLLYLAFKKINKEVVPLDIEINESQRIILISGPNAGGKSVALKTVALLQYMVQCGLLIPVKNTSKTGIFKQIFIDIGDEQSIENDLSTYSSHLYNMKMFLEKAQPTSLVLIDEFGTGTEPIMGAAIAESILQELNNKQVRGVLTTHYSNLKHFAASTEGIENAAMLFDNSKLEPLFIMEIGKPGSSFAFEIAKSIGLPSHIINNAIKKTGTKEVKLEKHLQQIEHDKRIIRNEKSKARLLKKELTEKVDNFNKEKMKLLNERKEIIDASNKKAENILLEANKLIENTIREIKTNQAEKEATKLLRKKFEDEKKQILNKPKKEKQKITQKINKVQKKHVQPKKIEQKIVNQKIEKNDYVEIINSDSSGQVDLIKDKKAIVVIGNMRTVIDINKLKKITKQKAEGKNKSVGGTNIKLQNKTTHTDFLAGLDVRGKRADEALQIVARYLDDAIVSHQIRLTILHGTGNGILKNIIRDYLNTQPQVISCKDERIQLGGSGITIVKLSS